MSISETPYEAALPEGRPILTIDDAASRALARRGVFHLVGAEGSAPTLVARALAARGAERVVVVTPELDEARRAAADLAYFTRGLPFAGTHSEPLANAESPLVFVPPESSPWSDVRPDRRAQMTRVSALFHMARGLPWKFLVTSAAGLVRRVAPKKPLLDVAVELVAESE